MKRRTNPAWLLAAALAAGTATAQEAPRPGPMQSGTHAGAPAGAPAGEPAGAPAAAPSPVPEFDVNKLFANSCGWCHSKGGREAGKGPQLMGSEMSDAQIVARIKTGKVGQMPAFASSFNDEQLNAIVRYIRELKPSG